ncbi:MAG: c-type cytochrome, partial [Acidobacteriaceae bacterium]|nr:c-type cytochrome [Acidobacteriaceae bacterium]
MAPPRARGQSEPSKETAAERQIFTSRCAGCHGLDARGGEHGPNLAMNATVQRLS